MFRAVRCTTALLALLGTAACSESPTAPSVRPKAPETVVPVRTSADCDPATGVGCCFESQPWWC